MSFEPGDCTRRRRTARLRRLGRRGGRRLSSSAPAVV